MEISKHLDPFERWARKYQSTRATYTDVWADIGGHPLDVLFWELADIYVDASAEGKRLIEAFFPEKLPRFSRRRQPRLLQLILFVRRLSRQVLDSGNPRIVRAGLDIASIEGGRYDFRDTVISLCLLRYAAEQRGIDFSALVDGILPAVGPKASAILTNARNHPEADIAFIVKGYGPPEWRDEI